MRATFTVANFLAGLIGPSLVEPRGDVRACLCSFYRDATGQPRCRITSRHASLVARGGLELDSLEGEAVLAFPFEHLAMIRTLPPDDVLNLEYSEDDGEGYRIRLCSASGLRYEHSTYNPRLLGPCDKDFETALNAGQRTVNAPVLGVALALAKEFLPTRDEGEGLDPHFLTTRVFDLSQTSDGKMGGILLATDHTRALSFECDGFASDLVAHRDQIPTITSFLGSCPSGRVSICCSPNLWFAADADGDSYDTLLGWARTVKTHTECRRPPGEKAPFRLQASKDALLSAIEGAKVTIAHGPAGRVRLRYSHTDQRLRIRAAVSAGTFESPPIGVRPREGSAAEDFEYSCQLKHLTSLIADCTGHEIALRVYPLPKTEHTPRPGAGLYTIDEFVLDARARVVSIGPDKAETVTGGPETFACRVIRFVPSVV